MNQNKLISRKKFIGSAALGSAFWGLSSFAAFPGEKVNQSKHERDLRFLFQGDSITDGNRGRNEDPNHIMGHGYAFSVASRIGADFPENGFTFINRGVSGNTVGDLEKRWQSDTLDLKPDVLSLLVGVNDVGSITEQWSEPKSLDEFDVTYRNLLTQCKQQNPEMILILGLPFVFPVGNRKQNWDTWKNETAAHSNVIEKIGKDFGAICIDYQKVFEKASGQAPVDYWIWDGIHPTVFGHELMAREWIRQASNSLKFLKHYECAR